MVLTVDMIKLLLETYFYSRFTSFLDGFIVTQVVMTLFGVSGCIIGFSRERYYYFWLFIVLKVSLIKRYYFSFGKMTM